MTLTSMSPQTRAQIHIPVTLLINTHALPQHITAGQDFLL